MEACWKFAAAVESADGYIYIYHDVDHAEGDEFSDSPSTPSFYIRPTHHLFLEQVILILHLLLYTPGPRPTALNYISYHGE